MCATRRRRPIPPSPAEDCVTLVILWQVAPDDRTGVALRPDDLAPQNLGNETTATPLHANDNEAAAFTDWAAGATIILADRGGMAALVNAFAAELPRDRIHLGSPVLRISQ